MKIYLSHGKIYTKYRLFILSVTKDLEKGAPLNILMAKTEENRCVCNEAKNTFSNFVDLLTERHFHLISGNFCNN